ncbi:MAG: EamA family transporter, partial [Cetobacterium sp.]
IICFIGSTIGLILIIGVSSGGKSDITGIDGITRTIFQLAAAVMVIFPYVFGTEGFHILQLDNIGLINLIIVGIVHTGIVYVLYFSSLSELSGQEVSVLSYLDPLFAILISILWMGESITQLQLLGGGMILLFTLTNEMKIYKKSILKAK